MYLVSESDHDQSTRLQSWLDNYEGWEEACFEAWQAPLCRTNYVFKSEWSRSDQPSVCNPWCGRACKHMWQGSACMLLPGASFSKWLWLTNIKNHSQDSACLFAFHMWTFTARMVWSCDITRIDVMTYGYCRSASGEPWYFEWTHPFSPYLARACRLISWWVINTALEPQRPGPRIRPEASLTTVDQNGRKCQPWSGKAADS